MHLLKFAFVLSASVGHRLARTLVHLVRPTSWKHWPIRLNSVGPLSIWVSKSWVKIFDLKLGSMNTRMYSGPNHALSGATCLVISLAPFSKDILIQSCCFKPSLIRLSGVPLAPKEIQQVYQLNWGVCCALIRSRIVPILACLGLDHAWVLIVYLLDRAGISTSAKDYYNSDKRSSRWPWIGCWNVIKKQCKDVEYVAVKITTWFIMRYNSICLMCCHWWHILLPLPLSYP